MQLLLVILNVLFIKCALEREATFSHGALPRLLPFFIANLFVVPLYYN